MLVVRLISPRGLFGEVDESCDDDVIGATPSSDDVDDIEASSDLDHLTLRRVNIGRKMVPVILPAPSRGLNTSSGLDDDVSLPSLPVVGR